MGHYCRICGKTKPNEKFSGKGHRTHICKQCARLPKEERDRVDHMEEMYGYWLQKNISKKNVSRLSILSESNIQEVADMAKLLHDIAVEFPFKRKRIGRIAKEMPKLIPRMEKVGLIHNWIYNDYGEYIEDKISSYYSLWDEYCDIQNSKA